MSSLKDALSQLRFCEVYPLVKLKALAQELDV